MRLLARREHGARELADKLRRKGHDPAAVAAVVARLAEEGWQSDARYAEAVVRTRVEAGYGPLRIALELEHAGIAREVVHAALAPYETQWPARAEAARRRRFGAEPPDSPRERARQTRFLLYRGFPADLVRRVLAQNESVSDPW